MVISGSCVALLCNNLTVTLIEDPHFLLKIALKHFSAIFNAKKTPHINANNVLYMNIVILLLIIILLCICI